MTPRLSPLMLVLAGVGCAAGSSTTNQPVAPAVPEESVATAIAGDRDIVSDSAADAEILEFLAASKFDPASPDYAARGGGGGPEAMASTVTWDIGVQPFIDHHRVRYTHLLNRGSYGAELCGFCFHERRKRGGWIGSKICIISPHAARRRNPATQ